MAGKGHEQHISRPLFVAPWLSALLSSRGMVRLLRPPHPICGTSWLPPFPLCVPGGSLWAGTALSHSSGPPLMLDLSLDIKSFNACCCPRIPFRPLQYTGHAPAFFTRTGLCPVTACSCELISPHATIDWVSRRQLRCRWGTRSLRSPCMLSGCGQFSPVLIGSVALSKEMW